MSDIRFNQWLHQSGTGGVSQDHIGNIGIGTTNPSIVVSAANTAVLNVGVITANNLFVNNAFNGDITGNVTGNISGATGTFSGNVDIADKIIHTGDTDTAMRFPADNTFAVDTAGTERFRIDSSGNIGIGTASPTAPLAVMSSSDPEIRFGYNESQDHRITWDSSKVFLDADPENANGNSALGFRVDGSEAVRITSGGDMGLGTASPTARLDVRRDTTDGKIAEFHQSTGYGIQIRSSESVATIRAEYNQALIFESGTTATERLRITSDGKLGHGTASPSSAFHGTVSSGGYGATFESTANGGESVVTIKGKKSDGTVRSAIFKYDNADMIRLGTSQSIPMRFETGDTERLKIYSDGRVIIHGNGTIRTAWSGAVCSINNLAMMDAGSGFSWGLRANSGDTQWCLERIVGTNSFSDSNIKFRVYNNGNYSFAGSSTSDRDIKENIEDISGTSLNLIDQLRPRTFNFKESEGYSTEPKTGFVAQEIGAVIPSIVNGTDGQKDMGVDYNGLVAHLVKAVQELKAENDSLRSRLDTAGL